MNDSNHTGDHDIVARVLVGLRDIEAPTGMDQRILASLHHRAATNTSPARSSLFAMPLFWLAATAAAIVAITLWWSAPSHPTSNLATTNTPTNTVPTTAATLPAASSMARSETSGTICQNIKDGCPIHDAKRHGWGHSSEARTAVTEPPTTPEAAPLPETLAASHPEPPLPLTQQEQLLLRILHKGDPIELASINNDFRDRQPLRDAEDFQRFFKPPAASHSAEAESTTGEQPAQQNQPDLEAQPSAEVQPAPEPEPNDTPQQ